LTTRPKNNFFLNFFLSLCIVALGQPARIDWLGAVAAFFGFALFFLSLSPLFTRLQKFLAGSVWFTVVQLIQLSWMTSIEFQGYYILFVYSLLSLWLGCQFGLLTLLVANGEGKISIRKILFCASLWTLMEWARLLILCGFSWNPIGLALTSFIPSLQFSSVFGILGLSFWVMMTNLAGLNVLRSRIKSGQTVLRAESFLYRAQYIFWIILASFPYLFGVAQLNYQQTTNKAEKKILGVALIQTDLLPSEKAPHIGRAEDFISPFEQWERILYFLKEKQMNHWDLIVLPEAAVPMPSDLSGYPYFKTREVWISAFGPEIEKKFPPLRAPFAEQRYHQGQKIWCVSNLFWCQVLANLYTSEVVAGLDHADRIENKNFNSAFYFKPNSLVFQRYDKQILLPLAEYLPFDFLRPLTKNYGIYDFFSQGNGTKIFGEKVRFSPSICYEETFSEVMRNGKTKGAELFVNVTNDNYYPDSSLHEQHLFHARLRAVENGIPLIRACNSGGTAVIDSFGQLLAKFEAGDAHRANDGVLTCHFTVFQFPTLFSFWGEGGIISLCFIFFLYNWRMSLATYCK
jgi:apolipoprotein N-acyltransferase